MRAKQQEYISGLEDVVKSVVINETRDTQGRRVVSVKVGMEKMINSVLLFIAHLYEHIQQSIGCANQKLKR